MNPTELKFNIVPMALMILGLIVALILGVFIGGSEIFNLGLIFGLVALTALVSMMRQHIWLLIPIFWGFNGIVSVLPLPFALRDLVLMLVAGISCALFALRILKFKNRWDALDLILLLNLFQILIVFLTHPFGLKATGTERVGARPYFNIAVAAVAYFILSNQSLSPRLARRLPILMIVTELCSSALFLLSRAFKSVGYELGKIYDGYLPPTYHYGLGPSFERMTGVARGGMLLITGLCSYFRPLTLVTPVRLWRSFLFLLGLTLVLISGFRSELLSAVVIFVLASYFRKGRADVTICLIALFLGASFLILFNSFIHPLPLSVQRSLSSLPGDWDPRSVRDASDSTDWRFQMWKDIPKGTRYINNKIMGDGFGFSRAELSAMERQQFLSGEISQEDSMIIGAFHNGPLSAVRFVGIVGMILYYALLIYSAVYAWRLIRAADGTDYFPLALFIGLAIIWEPLNYTIVFGAFDSGVPNTLFNAGMLKMLSNSLQPIVEAKEQEVQVPLRSRRLEGIGVRTV